MKLKLTMLIIASLASGCTSYKPDGFTGGFSDLRLSENVFQVSARGNAFASAKEIQEMVLLRSAEVVLGSGYRYFEVARSANEVKVTRSYTPPTAYTSGTVQNYGNNSQLNATTQYVGGGTTEWNKPESSMVVIAHKERPSDGKAYVDAQLILQSLGPKYIKK